VHVARLIDELDPRAIVHLGLAAGRARIALERVAVNVMDFDTPDNTGYRACNEPCVVGGPPAYFATLPLPEILQMLLADGVPAYVSKHRRHLSLQPDDVLHAPPARRARSPRGAARVGADGRARRLRPPAVAARHGGGQRLEQPSMDAALMVRAVEIVVGVVARAA
jgi:pyrrolidone-carboxylate peptidase